MAEQKTNVMRVLEQKKIRYAPHEYAHGDGAVDGVTVAALTGIPVEKVFKTLVTRGASKTVYVFVIPVACELDLKKAAKSVGEKSVAMIHVSEINALTGYVRGGCSPVGMKKPFPTWIDETALLTDAFYCSAGRLGAQIGIDPEALAGYIGAQFADLTEE